MALYRGATKLAGIGNGFSPENVGSTGQVLTKTSTGYAYDDAPSGLPEGGTTGQVVTKTASGAEWADPSGLPSGGTTGQIIMMTANGPAWVTPVNNGFVMQASDSPIAIKYIWAGTEAEYTNVTKDANTHYDTY